MTALAMLLLAGSGLMSGLAPFQPYSGHCWSASLSPATRDRHCFAPVFGGAHLRDTHVVTKGGRAVYSGETIYSVQDGQIVFTYWNSLGGVGRGTASVSGNDVKFSLVMHATPDAAAQSVDSVWRRSAKGYDVISAGDVRHFLLDDQ